MLCKYTNEFLIKLHINKRINEYYQQYYERIRVNLSFLD